MSRYVAIGLLLWSSAAALSLSPALADTDTLKAACSPNKSPKLKEIKDRGVLRFAIGISAPYGAKDQTGTYVGTEPENATDLASILGVQTEIKDYDYSLLPPTVATGAADIVGAGLYVTDARKKVIEFSDVYEREGQVFVTLATRDDLNSIEDINKAEVTIVQGTGSGQVDLAKKLVPEAKLVTANLDNYSVKVQFLMNGQADVSLNDALTVALLQKAAGATKLKIIGKKGPVSGVALGDDMFETFDIAFGVAKGDPGFLGCVNAFVKDMLDTGRFNERYSTWVKKMAD